MKLIPLSFRTLTMCPAVGYSEPVRPVGTAHCAVRPVEEPGFHDRIPAFPGITAYLLFRIITEAVLIIACSALAHPALCQLTGNTGMVRNDQVLAWNSTHNGRFGLSPDFVLNLDSNLSTSLNMTTEKEDRWYDSVFNRAELLS